MGADLRPSSILMASAVLTYHTKGWKQLWKTWPTFHRWPQALSGYEWLGQPTSQMLTGRKSAKEEQSPCMLICLMLTLLQQWKWSATHLNLLISRRWHGGSFFDEFFCIHIRKVRSQGLFVYGNAFQTYFHKSLRSIHHHEGVLCE